MTTSATGTWFWEIAMVAVFAAAGASGCSEHALAGTDAATDPAAEPAQESELLVGPPVDVQRAASTLRTRFRTSTTAPATASAPTRALTAAGAQHRIEVGDGVARITGATHSVALRQQIVQSLRTALRGPASVNRATARGRLADQLAALHRQLADTASGGKAPTLELRTLSIARAGYECVSGAGNVTLGSDGAALRSFAGCSERWTNDDRGGEVSFQLAERPAGQGDLTVVVRARVGEGATPAAVTSDALGLHFASTAPGTDGFLFGHATWIDAAGVRVAIPARWSGGRIELTVPAALVDSSRYPAVLDPVVGPDLGTDRPVLVPASAGLDPDVAFDGTNFLVAFEDAQRVRAVRVDAAGNVLSDAWIDLGEDGQLQFNPSVAFGGGRYFLDWWQDDGMNLSIRGRLLETDGTPVGTTSFAVASDQGLDATAVWNGQTFLAGWIGFGDPGGIKVAAVDVAGNVVAGSEHNVSTDVFDAHPHFANGATVSAIAWEDESTTTDFTSRIRAARIARDATVLDPGGVRLSTNDSDEKQVKLAADGDDFLIAWHRLGAPGAIRGAMFDGTGSVTAPDFAVSRSTGEASLPGVAFNGDSFLVAWADERDVPALFGASVSAEGVVQGDADVRLSALSVDTNFGQTAPIWNGSEFLVAFHGIRTTSDFNQVDGIWGTILGPDLSIVTDELSFTRLPNGQFAPQVVWDGRDYVVSWIDERAGSFDQASARAVRISAAGAILDPDGIELTPAENRGAGVGLASNGARRSVLTWATNTGQASFRELAANGTLAQVRSATPTILAEPPAIAGNGDEYLMVFTAQNGDFNQDVSARLLRANNTLGPVFPVQQLIDFGAGVTAAGTDFLVHYFQNGGGKLVTVSRTGGVGSPIDFPGSSTSIASATGDTNSLVTWAGPNSEIFARLYDRGAFRGPTLQVAAEAIGSTPTVAWDGRRYWVMWTGDLDTRRPMVRHVTADGTLGRTFVVVDDECNGPALASSGNGQLLLGCYKFTNQFREVRVTTRLIDTRPAGGPFVPGP